MGVLIHGGTEERGEGRLAVATLILLLSPGSLAAQTPYVGATFIADIFRVSDFTSEPTGNGESYGGAMRVGTPLGERWGVELELARGGEAERTTSPGLIELPRLPEPFPVPGFRTTRQITTLSPTVWWNQRLSNRASLVYHGGVAFTRVRSTVEEMDDPRVPLLAGSMLLFSELTVYDADAAGGLEMRVAMTDHLRLTVGVRMQTAVGNLAIRPGVGVVWEF